jgi:hypothetical protein
LPLCTDVVEGKLSEVELRCAKPLQGSRLSVLRELPGANDQSWTAAVALDWLAGKGCDALRSAATILQPGRY